MIVQAALDLTEADLPSTNRAYPLELVRALAIAWVYSGLRSNELVRLRTGCIRWQHEEVTVAETGERVDSAAYCFLYNAPEGLSLFELMKWLGHVNPATTQHYTRMKPTKLAAAYSKADRNSRLIEALVETKADAEGKVKIYYVLGDHGWCSNADWSSCLYRMACIKCPFFVPKEQAQ